MNAIEIKTNLHSLIEKTQNVSLLGSILEVLNNSQTQNQGELWNSLTNLQKKEVLESYFESENDTLLVDSKEVFKKLI